MMEALQPGLICYSCTQVKGFPSDVLPDAVLPFLTTGYDLPLQ